ncbi:YesL family protein [Metabacillus halosaccharovorans]|uniref:YesL family protein n=1 Tax=Metabacillus halosaccharovorans TaxID=930124 RepID=UPI001C1F41B3|nr:YesL family protein [Metabacillus halosaccharovorans]MBU7591279.1 DUF624 domain-containing protein [Metabacillus halosaccharovorans]
MQGNGLMSGFYKISGWISRFAYLNMLWIISSLLGLIIFGLFPATVSTFAVLREWIKEKDQVSVFHSFFTHYKKEFIKSNLLGIILSIIGFILYVDLKFIFHNHNGGWLIISSITVLVCIMFILMVLYVFPVYVTYQLSVFKIIQNSFLYMFVNPRVTIMMVAASITFYCAGLYFPGTTLIFGVSLYSFCIMWYSNRAFIGVQQKKDSLLGR